MKIIENLLGLGLEARDLSFVHLTCRVVVVFLAAILIVRAGDKRFLAKMSALDVVLGFILASMLARAVNGSAAFFPTLGAAVVLVLVHKGCAALAFRSRRVDTFFKGSERLIIKDGEVQGEAMKASHLTREDLLEELRQEGQVLSPDQVEAAFIERSGKISVVPREEHRHRR